MGWLRRAIKGAVRELFPELLGQILPPIRALGDRLAALEVRVQHLERLLDLPEPPSMPTRGGEE